MEQLDPLAEALCSIAASGEFKLDLEGSDLVLADLVLADLAELKDGLPLCVRCRMPGYASFSAPATEQKRKARSEAGPSSENGGKKAKAGAKADPAPRPTPSSAGPKKSGAAGKAPAAAPGGAAAASRPR